MVAALLIQTPPSFASALIVEAFTQRALLESPALVAEFTVTVPATTFGWELLEPPVTPSWTEPVTELSVTLFVPALTEPTSTLPWPPITTGPPPAVTEDTVTGVVAALLIQTPPFVASALMVEAFTQSASLESPALVAEFTVTVPATTFGCELLEPPVTPSWTEPVTELSVTLSCQH